MLGRYTNLFGQAEQGAPPTSARGQAYERAIVPDRVVYRAPTVGTGHTIRFYPLFGTVVTRPAFNRYVFAPSGYAGIFPLEQQPLIRRPNPWSDPTRGAP